jgi:hypothetical protein
MSKQLNSLAPLKESLRDYMYQRMPDSTREVLLENLLDQAYLAAIIDVSNEEIERLKEEQKKVHA